MTLQLKAGPELMITTRVCHLILEMLSPWYKYNDREGSLAVDPLFVQRAHKDLPVNAGEYELWRKRENNNVTLAGVFDHLDFVIARRFIRMAAENRRAIKRG